MYTDLCLSISGILYLNLQISGKVTTNLVSETQFQILDKLMKQKEIKKKKKVFLIHTEFCF